MAPERRREQLLDLGAHLFATRPYEDVHIDEVAEHAGVSRGLLYHHFPNKRAFFLAILEREAAQLRLLTEPREGIGPIQRLRAGVDAYLIYCRDHEHSIRMVYNGAGSTDPSAQAVVTANLNFIEDKILGAVCSDEKPHRLLRVAIRSWLAFLRAAAHDWLGAPDIPRDNIRELCVTNFVSTLVHLPEHATPSGMVRLLRAESSTVPQAPPSV